MSKINRVLMVGLLSVGITVATAARSANQLFEASWTTKSFGNMRTTGTGVSGVYSNFGMPQGVQCNANQPRCNFSETPTDGSGNFAPLGGSQMMALFCGAFTGPRPAKGATLTTGGKNKRPIPPLYRNPGFFTAGGAPNHTVCSPTSTDGFGGKGLVQVGHPITGSVNAVTTAKGGFNFPAAPASGKAGLRATGVFGEFGAIYPYVYSYTYLTMRNDAGLFGPGSGLGNAYIKLPRQGGQVNAHIEIKQGAAKFGGVMKMLGALTTKVCYYRAGGCSLGENNWRYEAVGTTGSYRSAGGMITKGYQALNTAIYFNSGLGQFSSVQGVGSRFGWTTGSITVTAVVRGPHKTIEYAQGYDNRTTTSMGMQKGTIQLVTPLLTQWLQPAAKWETGGVGILRLKFVPEPHTWMMLVAGVSLLGAGFRMRGR